MLSNIPYSSFIIIFVFAACAVYVHYRGKVRHTAGRQLFDHSTFLSPVNCLFYLFSKLPNRPYQPVNSFPELNVLRENWQIIREEALALQASNEIKASDKLDDIGFNSFFRTGWKRFYLTWYGTRIHSAHHLCPNTVGLLERIPTIKAAMFASLPPGAKLVRHRDPYSGSFRYHLGLMTPGTDDCAIYVDGEPYVWKDGEDVIFDETYIHYAHNASDKPRIVLFCDVRRPVWFPPINWLGRAFEFVIMRAAATKNMDGDRVGGLNRAFGQLYKIRQVGKRIKSYNRHLYYALKYLLFGALFYWIFF